MIDNLRVTLMTTGGRRKRLDLKPGVAFDLAAAILKELGLPQPRRPAEKKGATHDSHPAARGRVQK